jgi:hypothetical protein
MLILSSVTICRYHAMRVLVSISINRYKSSELSVHYMYHWLH